MIIDRLENIGKYAALHPLFPEAVAFLRSHDLATLQPGQIVLQPGRLWVNVEQIAPKAKAEALLEAHRDFMDIQLPLSHVETMGYTPEAECRPADAEYSADRDIVFFDGLARQYFTLEPGMFAVFLPGEGHAPAISDTGGAKLVFKVKI